MLSRSNLCSGLARTCGFALLLATGVSCASPQNVLTEAEAADGWELLFDGKTLDQWKDYNGDSLTQPWAYSHMTFNNYIMRYRIIRKRFLRIVCECCGHEFYAESSVNCCPECERHWNED